MQIPKPLGVEVVKGYPHMYKTIIEEKTPCSDLLSIVLFIAERARSGAPWVRKFGKLSIRENLVMT